MPSNKESQLTFKRFNLLYLAIGDTYMVVFSPLDAQYLIMEGMPNISPKKVCPKIGNTPVTLNPIDIYI